MPLFLDPVLFFRRFQHSTLLASRFVAAYVLNVGAMLARETVAPSRLEALHVALQLRLPGDSDMAGASPFCATDWGSDDEVWLHLDSPRACLPPPPTIRPLGRESKAHQV